MRFLCPLLILTLLAISIKSAGQDPNLPPIIRDIIKKRQDTAKLYYVDSILPAREYEVIKKKLMKRMFVGQLPANKFDKIILSKSERSYLLQELKAQSQHTWETDQFKYSQRIPVDSFWQIMHRLNYLENKNPTTRLYINVWHFSRPIFFRGGKLALVTYIFICGGLCGEYEYTFFKFTGRKWLPSSHIEGGVF